MAKTAQTCLLKMTATDCEGKKAAFWVSAGDADLQVLRAGLGE